MSKKCNKTSNGMRAGLSCVISSPAVVLVYPVLNYSLSSKPFPRARIAGAKRVCEASPETLRRLGLLLNSASRCTYCFVDRWRHSRTNLYDGVKEYHVQIRETGTRSQKQTESETRTRTEIPEERLLYFALP